MRIEITGKIEKVGYAFEEVIREFFSNNKGISQEVEKMEDIVVTRATFDLQFYPEKSGKPAVLTTDNHEVVLTTDSHGADLQELLVVTAEIDRNDHIVKDSLKIKG